jgi:2-dehydro-3-deoxyphosphogluconate aldolase/(4S)-4-hydroxy-2-oxoglutarate aldolase
LPNKHLLQAKNTQNSEAALKAANLFNLLFGFAIRDGAVSAFAGEGVEIMKALGYGSNGHIAIGTNSVFRAAAWIERQGIALDKASVKTDAKGAMTLIYLQDEIAGFGVHLVQKK